MRGRRTVARRNTFNSLNDGAPVGDNDDMNDPQPIDPRRRIRELLAIPDRDRTDAEWDELNELEIRTAPGNREVPERSQDKRFNQPAPGHAKRQDRKQDRKNPNGGGNVPRAQEPRQEIKPQENRSQEGRNDGRPPRRQHRRPKRSTGNSSGNGGPANAGGSGGGSEGGAPAA